MTTDAGQYSFKHRVTEKVPGIDNSRGAVQKHRLLSLDVYRGLIMVSLAFGGFGLAGTAQNHLKLNPDFWFWKTMYYEFTHTQWVGCSFWDLIQPSFMFMVGVSMAYSYAKRMKMGHSYYRMLGHALWRSLVLILLGVFLASNEAPSTNWSFMNVLAQIGLGYFFLFLLRKRTFPVQISAGILLLVATWILYISYPYSGIDLQQGDSAVGVSSEWAKHE